MKRLIILIIILCLCGKLFSQVDARNGWRLPTEGVFRIFIVFAEATGDPNYSQVVPGWPAGQMPDDPNIHIDAFVGSNYRSFISRYFHEMSFGKLEVIGDYYPHLLQIPYDSNVNSIGTYYQAFDKIKNICNGQQIQTAKGFQFPDDFDNWTLGTTGQVKAKSPDNYVDCIIVYWRVNKSIGDSRDGGQTYHADPDKTVIANKSGTSTYGRIYTDNPTIFCHEFAHGIIGPNEFHTGGGNGNGIFMENYGGYGMISSYFRNMITYNAWDRYRLGWKNPQHTYTISARNTNGQEINSDLAYGQALNGDSLILVLRDFSITGDAARIKLPYLKTLNSQAKEQWLWLENHQLIPGNIEYEEYKHGPGCQMYSIPKGLYLNLQVGNEDFTTYANSGASSISPIVNFGNYDIIGYEPSTNPNGSSITLATAESSFENPFTGIGFSSFHPQDLNNNDIIEGLECYFDLGVRLDGNEPDPQNYGYQLFPAHGSVFDAFCPGDKISISTNPAPVPKMTYFRTTTLDPVPRTFDNRKIYLNGLSVKVLEQQANGDVKVSVKWNDFAVRNRVRWCGDIVLNERVDLQPKGTLLLDMGLTPVRPVDPIIFNGKKVFSSPTVFTCNAGSVLQAHPSSTVILSNYSNFIAKTGSSLIIDDKSHLIVKPGSLLKIDSNAQVQLSGTGRITIQNGGYLCIAPGACIDLQDLSSILFLEPGAILGTNDSSSGCMSPVSFSGQGNVIDGSANMYIQNETIASNRYIGGKNIYLGKQNHKEM